MELEHSPSFLLNVFDEIKVWQLLSSQIRCIPFISLSSITQICNKLLCLTLSDLTSYSNRSLLEESSFVFATALGIMTLSLMTLSITKLSMITFSKTIRKCDTLYNDT